MSEKRGRTFWDVVAERPEVVYWIAVVVCVAIVALVSVLTS